jgi:hypothetical protein
VRARAYDELYSDCGWLLERGRRGRRTEEEEGDEERWRAAAQSRSVGRGGWVRGRVGDLDLVCQLVSSSSFLFFTFIMGYYKITTEYRGI